MYVVTKSVPLNTHTHTDIPKRINSLENILDFFFKWSGEEVSQTHKLLEGLGF